MSPVRTRPLLSRAPLFAEELQGRAEEEWEEARQMPPIDNAMPDLERQLEFQPTVNDDPVHLDARQISQFNEEGYVFPLDVFAADEAAAKRE